MRNETHIRFTNNAQLRLGNKLIGTGQPCYVIAEIGINHNGDIDIAKQLINVAVGVVVCAAIGAFQGTTLKQAICSAMAASHGRCVDAFRAFNGASGTENAYARGWLTKNPCCYPSGKGQQVMAQLVFDTGLAPLR